MTTQDLINTLRQGKPMTDKLMREIVRELEGKVALAEALKAIEVGRAQVPDRSTIFMNGTTPLMWKELNRCDMQELAGAAIKGGE